MSATDTRRPGIVDRPARVGRHREPTMPTAHEIVAETGRARTEGRDR